MKNSPVYGTQKTTTVVIAANYIDYIDIDSIIYLEWGGGKEITRIPPTILTPI